jgi:hypothetical protein
LVGDRCEVTVIRSGLASQTTTQFRSINSRTADWNAREHSPPPTVELGHWRYAGTSPTNAGRPNYGVSVSITGITRLMGHVGLRSECEYYGNYEIDGARQITGQV